MEGGAGRYLRSGRRTASEPRRWIEGLRPPGRGIRSTHAVRVLATAARRGPGEPSHRRRAGGARIGPDAQPGRSARRMRVVRVDRRNQVVRLSGEQSARGRERVMAAAVGQYVADYA